MLQSKKAKAPKSAGKTADADGVFKVHLLDLGEKQYGDCVLCQFGEETVLIDGSHRGDDAHILKQLKRLLKQQTLPLQVSLIIVTHPHDDHIGCLPRLVAHDALRAEWALLADPKFRWGGADEADELFVGHDYRVRALTEALLEEDRSSWPDAELEQFIDNAGSLSSNYRAMLRQLAKAGATVVRNGTDPLGPLEKRFEGIGLKVVGPDARHLETCAELLLEGRQDLLDLASETLSADALAGTVSTYRSFLGEAADSFNPNRGAINLQSIVTLFEFNDERLLFAGDMQFSDPQVNSTALVKSIGRLRQKIADKSPYSFVKLSHHGSDNGFNTGVMSELGDTALYGICGGHYDDRNSHPHPKVLKLLKDNSDHIQWVRTDHNGLVTITFGPDGPQLKLSAGELNDGTKNHETSGPHDGLDLFLEDVSVSAPAAPALADASELVTRIPRNATRFEFSVEFAPPPHGAPPADEMMAVAGAVANYSSALSDVEAAADAVRLSSTPPRSALVAQFNRARENGWLAFFAEAAQSFNWPVELLLAIASRETNVRNILGDGGHGHGIMQIDDRSFPNFTSSDRWKIPRLNILKGAEVLDLKRRFLSRRGVTGTLLARASVAAYNGGEARVKRAIDLGRDVDSVTTQRNYSADVLGRSAIFRELLA